MNAPTAQPSTNHPSPSHPEPCPPAVAGPGRSIPGRPAPDRPAPCPPGPGRALSRRLIPWVLLLFAGVRAVNVATVQMPFNGWDELSHIAAAYYVHKNGHMPTARSVMSRDLVPFVEAHPHPTSSLTMLRGVAARSYPGGDPLCGSDPPKRIRMYLYQAQHGPLYYHLMALLIGGTDPESLLAWTDAGRMLNIALLLGTLWLWRAILARIVPRDGPLAWLPDGVTLLLASFSYVHYNFVRFSNDALALFLGTAALALYFLWIRPREARGRGQGVPYALLGAVTGLAVLAKATAMVLLPVFAGALLWRCRPRRAGREALIGLAAFGAGYAALAGFYHLECLARYGQLTGMQEAVMNSFRGYTWRELLGAAGKLHYTVLRNPLFYNATLHLAGWSNLISPQWINLGFKTVLTLSGLALCLGLLGRQARAQAALLLARAPELPLLLVAGCAALFFHALHSALCWGIPTTGPWYGMLHLPVLFLFMLLGPALCGRCVGASCLLMLALLCNVATMGGTYDALLTQQTNNPDFYRALKAVVAHHALLRPDLHGFLTAEFIGLAASIALVLEEVVSCGRAVRRDACPRTGPRAEASPVQVADRQRV